MARVASAQPLSVTGQERMAFKINRIIGFIFAAALVYGLLQTFGLLPSWAPALPLPRSGPPAA